MKQTDQQMSQNAFREATLFDATARTVYRHVCLRHHWQF
jgi:hypothetical protein